MLNPIESGWQKPTIPEKQNQSEEENRNKYATCYACFRCPMMKRLKKKLIEYMTTTKPHLARDYCRAETPVDILIAEQLTETGWDLEMLKSTY